MCVCVCVCVMAKGEGAQVGRRHTVWAREKDPHLNSNDDAFYVCVCCVCVCEMCTGSRRPKVYVYSSHGCGVYVHN